MAKSRNPAHDHVLLPVTPESREVGHGAEQESLLRRHVLLPRIPQIMTLSHFRSSMSEGEPCAAACAPSCGPVKPRTPDRFALPALVFAYGIAWSF